MISSIWGGGLLYRATNDIEESRKIKENSRYDNIQLQFATIGSVDTCGTCFHCNQFADTRQDAIGVDF